MRNILIGLVAGLLLASFAPRAAHFARYGFDTGREIAGSTVQHLGHAARP